MGYLLAETFNPADEFKLHDWIPIHIGPLDLSINKAVVYLALGSLLTIILGIVLMRARLALLPDKRQTIGEAVYDITQTQIAEQGLPSKAINRWFPYVATLFLFIWVVNLLGFIPLPFTGREVARHPDLGDLRGDLAALGDARPRDLHRLLHALRGLPLERRQVRQDVRAGRCAAAMVPAMAILEAISHFFRIVSLSVRLYANMLAGHMLILVSIGLIFILSGVTFYIVVPISFTIGIAFYLFEVVIVVTIQAFIFAALTAIYIGSAIEPAH